jgi:hypothetical protein
MTKKPSVFSLVMGLMFDLMIDLGLIFLGLALYFQFFVYQIFPVAISPAVTKPVGGPTNAAFILCGVPLVIGLISLVRSVTRFFRKLRYR